MLFSRNPLSLAVSLALTALWNSAAAQSEPPSPDSPLMTVVVVGSEPADVDPNSVTLDAADLLPMRAATSDTATLLRDLPGVSVYGAGGVSSLPVIRGLGDDRLRIKVDGMDLISACGNHMNPPLSYIDPTRVGSATVFAGIAPVSSGGDSIGGTILVESLAPEFAQAGQGLLLKGEAGCVLSQQRQRDGRQYFRDGSRRKAERDLQRLDRGIRQLHGRRRLQAGWAGVHRRPDVAVAVHLDHVAGR